MMSADADDVAYAMMSAAQMVCTAQRCNENTPEAFAFRGVFLCYRSVLHAPQRTSFLRSKTSLRQHIMPKAHHAEGHHLRSNIIFYSVLQNSFR